MNFHPHGVPGICCSLSLIGVQERIHDFVDSAIMLSAYSFCFRNVVETVKKYRSHPG